MDQAIERALRTRVPNLDPAAWRRRAPRVSRLAVFAAAASVLLAVAIVAGIGPALWSDARESTLAADVARHIEAEPQAFAQRGVVGRVALARTLASHDVRLARDVGDVVYAETCLFRGHLIPHLVVRTQTGLVTVLVLPDEHPTRSVEIAERRMSGRVIPVRGNAIAVVGQSPVATEVQARIVEAIEWGV